MAYIRMIDYDVTATGLIWATSVVLVDEANRAAWEAAGYTLAPPGIFQPGPTDLSLTDLYTDILEAEADAEAARDQVLGAIQIINNLDVANLPRPFHYVQTAASAAWSIMHNFGRYPASVTAMVGTQEVEPDINHPSVNQTTLTFSVPVTGRAELI